MAECTLRNRVLSPPVSKLEPLNFSRCPLSSPFPDPTTPAPPTHLPGADQFLQRAKKFLLPSVLPPDTGVVSSRQRKPAKGPIAWHLHFNSVLPSAILAHLGVLWVLAQVGWGACLGSMSRWWSRANQYFGDPQAPYFQLSVSPSTRPIRFRSYFLGVVQGKSTCFLLGSSTRYLVYNLHCPPRLVTTHPIALCLLLFCPFYYFILILTWFQE